MAECILPLCGCDWGSAQRLTTRVADRLALNYETRQGLAAALEDLCKSLSCQRTQGVAQSAIAKALRTGFPQASPECINAALTKIAGGLAATCPTFNQGLPAFVLALFRNQDFFQGVGELLACLLGPAEAMRVRATLNECLTTAMGDFFKSLCANAGSLLTCQPAARAAFPCCCGGTPAVQSQATPALTCPCCPQPAPTPPQPTQPAFDLATCLMGLLGQFCQPAGNGGGGIPAPSDGPIHRDIPRC